MTERSLGVSGILALGALVALTQCSKTSESKQAQVGAERAPTPSHPKAGESPAAPPADAYRMCGGQRLPEGPPPPRSGAVTVQLAPAFLDEMMQCRASDKMPADLSYRAGEGSVDDQGDCVFASVGVSCHYYSGPEFITSSTRAAPSQQGELRCVVPTDDPKSPHVFGARVTCSDPKRIEPPAEKASHAGKTGAACGAGLLSALARCQSSKCCDEGTLTADIGKLARDGKNDIRPDYRICEQTLTIDCSLLENMKPRPANAPALRGAKAVFVVSPEKSGD